MHSIRDIARAVTAAFLAGKFDVDGLEDRGATLFGRRARWIRPLARRVNAAFEGRPRPRAIAVTKFLLTDRGFMRACERLELEIVDRLTGPPTMNPMATAESWDLPTLCMPSELADWLRITSGQLEWFADLRGLGYKQDPGRLRHYHYRPLAKPGGQVRLIEAPKPRLKAIQQQLLADLVERIPVHAAAHGFRRGRSIASFATPHVGQRVVLKLDLRDFFPSISQARVQALFRTVGYPERVADLLAGLCTNAAPLDVWDGLTAQRHDREAGEARRRYAQPHLPQGAPTSPALANLCAYRLDCRLSALAATAGAVYTRYADDLAFSGGRDFERSAERFLIHVSAIVMEEGFAVHHRKSRIMRAGVRQRLAGIIVNKRMNVQRDDYDRLKATLTNCIRHGAASQNRHDVGDFQSHLLGRISHVALIHPARGEQLHKLFDKIEW